MKLVDSPLNKGIKMLSEKEINKVLQVGVDYEILYDQGTAYSIISLTSAKGKELYGNSLWLKY
jgi:hypothetical protein